MPGCKKVSHGAESDPDLAQAPQGPNSVGDALSPAEAKGPAGLTPPGHCSQIAGSGACQGPRSGPPGLGLDKRSDPAIPEAESASGSHAVWPVVERLLAAPAPAEAHRMPTENGPSFLRLPGFRPPAPRVPASRNTLRPGFSHQKSDAACPDCRRQTIDQGSAPGPFRSQTPVNTGDDT